MEQTRVSGVAEGVPGGLFDLNFTGLTTSFHEILQKMSSSA